MEAENLHDELTINLEIFPSLLSGVAPSEAQYKPDAKSWSILEVICHLLDEEREDFRLRLDITLHRPGLKWPPIDPQGWVISRNYNMKDFDRVLEEFLEERRKSILWLESLSSPDWECDYDAPFGSIKAGDLLASWVMHDTLHIRQIIDLKHHQILRLASPYDVSYAGDW